MEELDTFRNLGVSFHIVCIRHLPTGKWHAVNARLAYDHPNDIKCLRRAVGDTPEEAAINFLSRDQGVTHAE